MKGLKISFFLSLALLFCATALTAQRDKAKWIYGDNQNGSAIMYDNGRLEYQRFHDGGTIIENYATYDSTAFDTIFVQDSVVTLTDWGDFGPILDFKLILDQNAPGATTQYTYDIGAFMANDTIAPLTPHYGVADTLYHFVDDIFSGSNMATPDSNDTYILYLKYVKRK